MNYRHYAETHSREYRTAVAEEMAESESRESSKTAGQTSAFANGSATELLPAGAEE